MRGCWLVDARSHAVFFISAHRSPTPPPPLSPPPPPPPLFPHAAVVRRGAGVCGAAARGGRQRRRRRPQEGRQEAQGQEERAARQRGAVRRGARSWVGGGLVAAARRARVRARGGWRGAAARVCTQPRARASHTRRRSDAARVRRAVVCGLAAAAVRSPFVSGGGVGGRLRPAGSRFKLSHGGDSEGFLSTTPSVRASESTPSRVRWARAHQHLATPAVPRARARRTRDHAHTPR